MDQKNQADVLGMWAFLATEVLFFGGLFCGLMIYRFRYPAEFMEASRHLYQGIGLFNTFVLLFSSYTVVIAVHAAKHGNNKMLIIGLLATMALGLTFLGVKCVEYKLDFREHLVPNTEFFGLRKEAAEDLESKRALLPTHPELRMQAWAKSDWTFPKGADLFRAKLFMQRAQLFYVFYYTMTLVHAFHMIIGIAIFCYLVWKAAHGKYTPRKHAQIEMTGLYWHFVDIVWIFLFPLLYLIT